MRRRRLLQAGGLLLLPPRLVLGQPWQATPGGTPSAGPSVPAPPVLQGTVHHIPASGTDQSTLIQNTINAAAAGDTIFFDGGAHTINGTINLASNLLYISATTQYPTGGQTTRAVLNFSGTAAAHWVANTVSNVTIYGLTFVNTMMDIDGATTLSFTNCIMDPQSIDMTTSRGIMTLASASGCSGVTIQWNTFKVGLNGGAVHLWNVNSNILITRNSIGEQYQALTYNPIGNTSNNIEFSFNYNSMSHRFSLEYATPSGSTSTNVRINDNYFVTDNDGPSVVSAGSAEVARNFVRRVGGGSIYFGGIECSSDSPPGSPWMNVHNNYIRNEVPGETTGVNSGIYGSYTTPGIAPDRAHWTNNNEWNCTDNNISGNAIVTGTTHNNLGVPPIPACGAGP